MKRSKAVKAKSKAVERRIKLPRLPKAGTRSKAPTLTDDLTRKILDAISRGANLTTASNSVGLDPAVFARWLREPGEPFRTLQGLVRMAIASPEIAMLTAAMLGAESDPRVALEFLRVRWPSR